MNNKKALILHGGWTGHEPEKVAAIFRSELEKAGFSVVSSDTLAVLGDGESLKSYDLIFPCWTMGILSEVQTKNLLAAVHCGVGLGGIHGGMGDAFRGNTNYEWMVGGHFVGHPHVGEYELRKTQIEHPITEGFPCTYAYNSEQYYMLVDPVIEVLVETQYTYEERECTMPVVWTKHWGEGRVFYSSLGHLPSEFTDFPEVLQMTVKGLKWAAHVL